MLGKKKEDSFLKLLNEEMVKVNTAGEAFLDLVNNYENVNDKIANMKVLETECDMQAHKILNMLNSASRRCLRERTYFRSSGKLTI